MKKIPKYFEAIGRRKTATARVRISEAKGNIAIINEKPLEKYFSILEFQKVALSPLEKMELLGKFGVSAKVKGGGMHAQAEAIRHGIAKALTLFNPEFRKSLAKTGYLTRDPRMRERKKFGLRRARRAPQWQKR
ncbi:MAG: 30S ribosomal protein S9 [Candidatus Nealsonbacteria bacterium]